MTYVNKKRVEPLVKAKTHLNWMGGTSFDINDPLNKLRTAASSCFFGEPQYYHREDDRKSVARAPRSTYLSPSQVTYLRATLEAKDPSDWRGLAPAALMEKAIDEALNVSVEQTLALAVELRNEGNMRVTPQVILVRAAVCKKSKGTSLIRDVPLDFLHTEAHP